MAGFDSLHDRVFRDPVHGLVELKGEDRPLQTLLETRALQRLRRIKQLGFAWQVYPGAEHSRFGHALGTYHVAGRVTEQLEIEPQIARHIKVAALLHDIGHGPYSHAWEQAFGGLDHEAWGQRLVREDPELNGALMALDPDSPEVLCSFWDKSYRPAYARKLISSQLDCDRIDYLRRDGHYSGVGYAQFDLDWILYALTIDEVRGDRADPWDLVVDYKRGMYAVEQYLFARSYMYAQVYHHKTVRAAEWMFLKLLQRVSVLTRAGDPPPGLEPARDLARGDSIGVAEFLWLDDIAVASAVDAWAGRGPRGDNGAAADPVVRDLATRLVTRRLFKTLELGDDPAVIERVRPVAEEVAEKIFGDDATYYLEIDTATNIGYLADGAEEAHVVGHPRHGTATLGQLLSDLTVGRPISAIRLVCAPELLPDLRPAVQAALARS